MNNITIRYYSFSENKIPIKEMVDPKDETIF